METEGQAFVAVPVILDPSILSFSILFTLLLSSSKYILNRHGAEYHEGSTFRSGLK